MADQLDSRLVAGLIACGADPSLVDVEWDDLCQEDLLTFATQPISDVTLSRLSELTLFFPSRFVFAAEGLQTAFEVLRNKAALAGRTMEILRVQPIYGNGWTDGQDAIPEPKPFTIFARTRDRDRRMGWIVSKGHEFDGALLEAFPRHAGSSRVLTCQVLRSIRETVYGYCEVALDEQWASRV